MTRSSSKSYAAWVCGSNQMAEKKIRCWVDEFNLETRAIFSREVWTKEELDRAKATSEKWAYMFGLKEDDEDIQGHS
jgi:hypothetical protein